MSSNVFHWAIRNIFNWSNLRAVFVGSLVRRERQELKELYDRVASTYARSAYSEPYAEVEFVQEVVDEAFGRAGRTPCKALHDAACEFVYRLLMQEPVIIGIPDAPDLGHISLPAMHELRKLLIVKERVLSDPAFYVDIWREKIIRLIEGLSAYFPAFAFTDILSSAFQVSLIDVCEQPSETIERLAATMYDDDVVNAGFFEAIRTRLDDNLCRVSGMTKQEALRTGRKPLFPTDTKDKTARDILASYLSGTPFVELLSAELPFEIPQKLRFEHAHLLGGSGHGKTQFLQHLIMGDLTAEEPPGLIVIDSQGDMLRKIERLALFAPGERLADRILIVDPEDDVSPALNMFAAKPARLAGYSRNIREQIEAEIIELYNYIFGALAAEMTAKQSTAFAFIVRLMLSIPGATIHTLRELMEEDVKGIHQSKFKDGVFALDATARAFFENQFFNKSAFGQTRQQIARRLYGVLQVPAFDRMFSAPQNKLDMFDAMQGGKIVLVNTSKALLKTDASALFGRYMIAQTIAAAFERIAIPEKQRRPAFLLIDEAADYFDGNLETILSQARKFGLGVLFANQHLEQLSPALRASVAANTSIKFAGGVSDRDARALAPDMRTTPEFISNVRKHPNSTEFACYVRNFTPSALRLSIPFGTLEDAPRMTDDEYAQMIARNRERMGIMLQPEPAQQSPESQTAPQPQIDALNEW